MRKSLSLLILSLLAVFAPRTASAQMWFEADYLFWGRPNTSDVNFITSGTGSGDANLGFGSGYRIGLGGGVGDYEIEAILSDIGNWSDQSFSVLGTPIALDGTAANAIVFPGGAHSLTFNSGVSLAASLPAELSESEFLRAGSAVLSSYSTNLRDLQINFGSHRDRNWFRWGIGYREVLINENGGFGIAGTFDALDIDDAAGPAAMMGNDPNDGLAAGSLTSVGFVNIGGGGGFDSIDPTVPSADGLSALFNGSTENRLDGVQLTLAARTVPNDVLMLEAFTRLGLYHNRISGSVSEVLIGSQDANGIYQRVMQDSTAKASFGFNPGVRASLNLTDYISLTLGYEVMLLTGVGLGPDQLASVQTTLLGSPIYKVDSSGLFVGHGGNAGLEVRW